MSKTYEYTVVLQVYAESPKEADIIYRLYMDEFPEGMVVEATKGRPL